MTKYPSSRQNFPSTMIYELHCSKAVSSLLREELSSRGFIIAGEGQVMLEQVNKFQIPTIGIINVFLDMEEGYRIERVGLQSEFELIGEDKNRKP